MARKIALLFFVVFLVWITGCRPQAAPPPTVELVTVDPGKPSVVIVSPPSESAFPAQSRVMILSTSLDMLQGISRVELSANGVLVRSDKTPEDTPQQQYSLLQGWTPDQPGKYMLSVVAFRSDGTASPPAKINITIEEAEPAPVEEDLPCMVLASTRINIRSGPGTNYGVLDVLPLGETVPVTGRNDETTWWQIQFNTRSGWVFAELTYPEGDCENVPFAAAPAPGAASVQEQPLPGDEGTAPGVAPTSEVAPEDPEVNTPLIIPVNLSASVSDQVSFPEGDRVDRVQYEVTGMKEGEKARLLITAVCAGKGMEYVQFKTDGKTFGCAQPIISREVTLATRSGTITIEAVGGDQTNVFWVLTGTATKLALPLPLP
jgi:hypothetical protein